MNLSLEIKWCKSSALFCQRNTKTDEKITWGFCKINLYLITRRQITIRSLLLRFIIFRWRQIPVQTKLVQPGRNLLRKYKSSIRGLYVTDWLGQPSSKNLLELKLIDSRRYLDLFWCSMSDIKYIRTCWSTYRNYGYTTLFAE